MKQRVPQLDYLKGIFILLMVMFHLQPVELTYPTLRAAVYTFHMPAFLIISGFLANVEKAPTAFGKGLIRIVVPYIVFEALYIAMQCLVGGSLGAHNAIGNITAADFMLMMATQPTGPYWYLHTLALCTAVYYLVYSIFKLKDLSGLAVMGVMLYGLSLAIEGLDWHYVIYYLIGVLIMRSGHALTAVITPSWWAVLPLVVLFWLPDNYDCGSLAGIAITILVMSLLLAVYPVCGGLIRRLAAYIGRNSLAIVVFSPIFTLLAKRAAPAFDFDPTAVCFTIAALAFVAAGCLGCAWLSDKLHISRYIFAGRDIYNSLSNNK